MGISTFDPNAPLSWDPEDEAEGGDKLPAASEQAALESIFELLRQETRIDFSRYRKTTIMRRVTRRMSLNKQGSLSGYVVQLQENAQELRQLRDDLLLSITEFFRDPEVFEMLQSRVFPALVENRSPKSPIRVWVPGCATGEEVYSLAIGFQEFMEEQRLNVAVQFFGTDISEKNIVRARAATYSSKVTHQVSAARVERYFEKVGDSYRVTKRIRERCVFATQDLGSDPPFANIDLVSCRNVLIYFDEELQGVATSLFYFALNTSGFLLLGVSESLQNFDELFAPVEGGGNLFRKRVPPLRRVQNLAWTGRSRGGPQLGRPRRTDEPREGVGIDWPEGLAERVIVEEYGPPGVVVDSHFQIRQFRGRVSVYLEPSTGSASLKLSKMVRAELMPDVFVAVEEAKRTRASAKRSNVGCTIAQDTRTRVDIVVFPLCQEGHEIHYLIVFETSHQESGSSDSAWHDNVEGDVNTELFLLRRELKAVKHQLQAIIEEKEVANQDLWTANEEIQSANEELQSVNEEMEAAKEELESANEELVTLNEELQLKNVALSDSEGRFRGLVENSIDWIWETDSQGILTYSSPRVRELLGYAEAEVVGRGLGDLLPEVAARVFPAGAVSDDVGVIQIVTSAPNRQGVPVVFDTSCVLKGPNAGGLRGVSRDVSERERIAERLRRSQESLARAQEIAKLGHWELDLQGSDNLWSAQMFRMLDWDEANGPPSLEQFLEIVHPEDRASVVANIEQVVKTGSATKSEWRTNLKHAVNRTFEARVMPVRNAAGVLHRLVGTAMDVTEQRKATSDLRASELRFRTYVEAAPDAILVTDERGTVLEANQAAVQIGGYPREALIGAPLLQFVVPEEHLRFETEFVEVQRTGRFSGEFSFRLANGGERVGQMEAVKLSDVRFLIFAKDVTRHRDAEACLHAAREHLHHAEKMQAIGQLAGGIAHDFNNQLTTVLSFTELLLAEVRPNAEQVAYCEQIIGGVKRASELTAQLLAYSRKGKYQSVVVDVHRMSEEVSSLLQRTIDKKVEVVLNLRALESSTLGDPTQLQNALLNLALNARDAMESGGKLTIATRVVSGRSIPALGLLGTLGLGRYLELSVTDTGTGMTEEVKKRVFDPFFSTKSPGKGLGMGLPSVYGAVIGHQGAMRIESEPGLGSKFVVYLPVAPTKYETQGLKSPTAIVPRICARIMLVEDEPTLRSAMCAVLSHLGHAVKAFAGGRDAVDYYGECWAQVDLIILDMIMPGMNGRETFVALKEVNPNVVVLLASGYSLEGETEELMRNGVRGFLQKPFEKDRLAKAVIDALDAQSTVAALPSN